MYRASVFHYGPTDLPRVHSARSSFRAALVPRPSALRRRVSVLLSSARTFESGSFLFFVNASGRRALVEGLTKQRAARSATAAFTAAHKSRIKRVSGARRPLFGDIAKLVRASPRGPRDGPAARRRDGAALLAASADGGAWRYFQND